MKDFRFYLTYQLKQLFYWRNIVIFLVLHALTATFVQFGVSGFKNDLKKKDIFQEVEESKIEMYFNYRIYGHLGFRLVLLPHPTAILFANSALVRDIVAFVDSGDGLRLYKSVQGQAAFKLNADRYFNFPGMFILLMALIVLFYGFESTYHREYLRFHSTLTDKKKVFAFFMGIRSFLLFLVFLFLTGFAILQAALNGVTIPVDRHLLLFILLIFLVSFFFHGLGTVFGTMENKIAGLALALLSWFILFFIIPPGVDFFTANKANIITPVYEYEVQKVKILADFEKRAIREAGVLKLNDDMSEDVSEIDRKLVASYRNNEFKKLQQLESEMISQMRGNVDFYHGLSSLFPSTFFLSTTNELSSLGYENLIRFYKFATTIKREFFEFYLDKVYFSNYTKVEPFLKDDENVFPAKPVVSPYLLFGALITLAWIVLVHLLAYYRYRKSIFRLQTRNPKAKPENEVHIEYCRFRVWEVDDDRFNSQLFNLLQGRHKIFRKKGYNFKITLNGRDLTTGSIKENLFYLSDLSRMPGNLRVSDFLTLVMDVQKIDHERRAEVQREFGLGEFWKKPFGKLDIYELENILLALLSLKSYRVYLFKDVSRGMDRDFLVRLSDRIDRLCENDALVLFLAADTYVRNIETGFYFKEDKDWDNLVENWREIIAADKSTGPTD